MAFRTRRLSLAAGAMAVALAFAGCGDAPTNSSSPEDSSDYPSEIELVEGFDEDATFTFGYTAFPPSWDPTKSTSAADRIFYIPVYDGLFIEGIDGPEFGLATSYEPNDDGTSVNIELLEGQTFSDGTPFDSSWSRGQPLVSPIGMQQLIAGWDVGLIGQPVGSQVLLVVPADQGYGDTGSGAIPPGATLIFVVDILEILG